jgi:arsenate reductase-like glutaredoxin family protein
MVVKMEPLVLIHILAKDKADILPAWLEQNLDKLDYDRDRVILYFRTNNNNDDTAKILHQWIDDQTTLFERQDDDSWAYDWRNIIIEDRDIPAQVQKYGVHEWTPERFKALAELREEGIAEAIFWEADFYYTVDVDNFTMPFTLKSLVKHNQPVVAPFLMSADIEQPAYSNYHNIATANGYFLDNDSYYRILNRQVQGLIKCDVVHCTYLIRKDVLPKVTYTDGTDDYEYVIFSRELRRLGIPQYLDNTRVYGYLTTRENVTACVDKMADLRKAWVKERHDPR